MGTRADFYVGRDKAAEWLGSIAYDGYTDGNPTKYNVINATTEAEFRTAVENMLAGESHSTRPEQGWPWPWVTSGGSDCSYWFFDGKVYEEKYNCYIPVGSISDEIDYPDMTNVQNITYGERSGMLIVTFPKK